MAGFTPHIRIRSILALGVALPATIAAFAGLTANAQNVLPQGGFVVGGTVTGVQTATALTINQTSARAIINWNSFSVGATNSVTFNQPNSSAAILNRVTGATPSNIAGQINANGQVFLVNPNGIAIGPTGTVNVGGGFVASTLDISNSNFMAGNLQFFGNGSSARVNNQGTITVGSGGFVALLGGSVVNSGTISVPLGKVGFGAGEQITLDVNGDGFMQVALPSNATTASGQPLISIAGAVNAVGGRIEISAATAAKAVRDLVNVSGSLSATSLAGRDGAIVLGGGPGANVNVTGTLDVSGSGASAGTIVATGAGVTLTGAMLTATSSQGVGGTIVLTAADTVTLTGATVNASGATGGGAIRIGGDFNGGGNIAVAASTVVDAASVIKSDALTNGTGGTIGLWSQNLTSFAGQISATGVVGGTVQVSSAGNVNITGSIDVSGTTNAGIITTTGANVTLTSAMLNATSSQGVGGTIILTAADTVMLTGATLNASGTTGGGAIRVGGDFSGGGSIATAATTVVDATSVLKSDALASGNGGSVVQWSNNLTSFAGQISATGVVGGTVQVSSAGNVNVTGSINVSGTTNAGSITATGANVTLTGATLNALGETSTAAAGIITVTAANTVTLTGATLNASGAQGGIITVTAADTVTLIGATLNAPGAAVGGAIRVGGDFNGLGTIATASTTVVDVASVLSTNAIADFGGTGGTVVVWANNLMSFAGQISATGLSGGTVQVQVSPAGVMDYRGGANVRGANNTFGILMIDPPNIVISTDLTSGIATMTAETGFVSVLGGTVYVPTAKNSVLNVTTLINALQQGNVFVIAAFPGNSPAQLGNITINASIDPSISTSCGAGCSSTTVFNTFLSAQTKNLVINPSVTVNVFGGFNVRTADFANFATAGGGEVTVTSGGAVAGADIIAPTPMSINPISFPLISTSATIGGGSGPGGGSPGVINNTGGGTPLFGDPASGASAGTSTITAGTSTITAGTSTTTISYNTQPSTITNYGSGGSKQSSSSSGNSGSCSGSAISQSLNQKGSAVVFGGQGSSCN